MADILNERGLHLVRCQHFFIRLLHLAQMAATAVDNVEKGSHQQEQQADDSRQGIEPATAGLTLHIIETQLVLDVLHRV